MLKRVVAAALTATALLSSAAVAAGQTSPELQDDPAGIIDLAPGYSYDILATSCVDPVTSTESGLDFPMP